jgi:hypothetical protein
MAQRRLPTFTPPVISFDDAASAVAASSPAAYFFVSSLPPDATAGQKKDVIRLAISPPPRFDFASVFASQRRLSQPLPLQVFDVFAADAIIYFLAPLRQNISSSWLFRDSWLAMPLFRFK